MILTKRWLLSATADSGTGAAPPEDVTGQTKTNTNQTEDKGEGEAMPDKEPEAANDSNESPSDNTANDIKTQVEKAVAESVAEEMKKSSMSDMERKDYELAKRQKELDSREKALSLREMKVNTEKLLGEIGLSADVADVVLSEDMKKTAQNIKKFKECLDKEVHKQVTERLKGKTPDRGNLTGNSGNSVKNQFLRGLQGN